MFSTLAWLITRATLLVALFNATHAVSAWAYTEYDLAIASIDAGQATVSLTCWDDGKPCHASIPVRDPRIAKPIEITVRIKPGNADLRFRDAETNLIADGESYFHINLGDEGARTVEVALYEDPDHSRRADAQLGREPVWRIPLYRPFARLLIAIRAHH